MIKTVRSSCVGTQEIWLLVGQFKSHGHYVPLWHHKQEGVLTCYKSFFVFFSHLYFYQSFMRWDMRVNVFSPSVRRIMILPWTLTITDTTYIYYPVMCGLIKILRCNIHVFPPTGFCVIKSRFSYVALNCIKTSQYIMQT